MFVDSGVWDVVTEPILQDSKGLHLSDVIGGNATHLFICRVKIYTNFLENSFLCVCVCLTYL